MGKVGVNDRNIYDDAIFVFSPDCFVAFNANCDPSFHRKGVANLVPGSYLYKLGIHGLSKPKPKQYKALVQAQKVKILRDSETGVRKIEEGYFGINIHKGSNTTTSSEGCQTIPPKQWDAFINLVEFELKKHNEKELLFTLIEDEG